MALLNHYRENFRKTVIPGWYSALIQKLVISLTFFLSLMAIPVLIDFSLFSVGAFLIAFFYHHFFIYGLHRMALHRKMRGLEWAYKMHCQHHNFYTHDNMAPIKKNDEYMLLMPYHAVAAYLVLSLPGTLLIATPFDFAHAYFVSSLLAVGVYFGLYEFIHYISHLDREHSFSKLPFTKWMQEFHQLHHHPKYKNHKNFDILFPFFDLFLGTFRK